MVGLSQQARPLKKEQVLNIQSMLEDVDAMKKKLMDLKHDIPEPKPAEPQQPMEATESPATENVEAVEPAEEPQQPTKATESPATAKVDAVEPAATPMEDEEAESGKRKMALVRPSESTLSKQWRAMKLKPRMQVTEHSDCFIISAYVPGMKAADLSIKSGPDTITVEGVREPSPKEESAMRNQLKDRYRALTGKEFDYVCLDEDEDAFLLQMGAGRFGRFSETYKVPPYVDLEAAESFYQGGRLVVLLPFKKGYLAPHPFRTRAPPERGGLTNPFVGNSFVDDEDFWW